MSNFQIRHFHVTCFSIKSELCTHSFYAISRDTVDEADGAMYTTTRGDNHSRMSILTRDYGGYKSRIILLHLSLLLHSCLCSLDRLCHPRKQHTTACSESATTTVGEGQTRLEIILLLRFSFVSSAFHGPSVLPNLPYQLSGSSVLHVHSLHRLVPR